MVMLGLRHIGNAARSGICSMCLLVAGIVMHAGVSMAAPGDLDPDFGDFGRVQLPFDGGIDAWMDDRVFGGRPAIVRQSDGKVLVARTDLSRFKAMSGSMGGDDDWRASEVALARLLTDGTLDPSFGTGGVAYLQFRAGEAAGVTDMALLPDGRLVVVGYSKESGAKLDTGLALLRADGSLDPEGFGNGGRVALDLSGGGKVDSADSVVALDDGHIVVAGTADGGAGAQFFMVRMTPQGDVDPTFGDGDGFAWSGSIQNLRGLHRSSNGQFVACGTRLTGSEPDAQILRFDSSGSLVGGTGESSTIGGYLTACALQEDGSVILGIHQSNAGDGTWLGRLGVDGQLDMTFGNDEGGRTEITCASCMNWDLMGYPRIPSDIAILADGRLAVAIYGYGWGNLAVLTYASNGRSVTGFGAALTDRFYDVGWPALQPSAAASRLLVTTEGDLLAGTAGWGSTTVLRLKGSEGPGASLVGLLGYATFQSESERSAIVICRSGSTDGVVSVRYASRDDTAVSAADYVPLSGMLTWDDGEDGCRGIEVTVNADDVVESTESFWVELTDVTGAGLAMDAARINIVDRPASTPPSPPSSGGASNRQGGGGAADALLLALLALLPWILGRARDRERLAITAMRHAGRVGAILFTGSNAMDSSSNSQKVGLHRAARE